jgi:hypothetical protein
VSDRFHRTYCGGGDVDACRADVWASLEATITDLDEEFGTGEVGAWQRRWEDDAIVHTAAGITSVPDIPWQNRPTFQQIVQLPAGDPASPPVAVPAPQPPLPTTGSGVWAVVLGVVLLTGALATSRGSGRRPRR